MPSSATQRLIADYSNRCRAGLRVAGLQRGGEGRSNGRHQFLWILHGGKATTLRSLVVVPASVLAEARAAIAKLQHILGKKTVENETLREAVQYAAKRSGLRARLCKPSYCAPATGSMAGRNSSRLTMRSCWGSPRAGHCTNQAWLPPLVPGADSQCPNCCRIAPRWTTASADVHSGYEVGCLSVNTSWTGWSVRPAEPSPNHWARWLLRGSACGSTRFEAACANAGSSKGIISAERAECRSRLSLYIHADHAILYCSSMQQYLPHPCNHRSYLGFLHQGAAILQRKEPKACTHARLLPRRFLPESVGPSKLLDREMFWLEQIVSARAEATSPSPQDAAQDPWRRETA